MPAIVNAANCTVTAGAGGTLVVAKTGGADGTFDASAVSDAGIDGPFVLWVKPPASGLFYVGVSADPLAGIAPSSIERAVQINGAIWRASDSGFPKPASFPVATYVWMRRAGGVIDYLSGPTLAGAVVRRSIPDPGTRLFFDSAIGPLGLSFEARFDPIAATAPRRPLRGLTLGLSF